MSGELKFLSRLSKKEDVTEEEKEVLHMSKNEAKKRFLQLAKKGIIHLSKRSSNPKLSNTPLYPLATGMTIRLSKKQMEAFHQTNR